MEIRQDQRKKRIIIEEKTGIASKKALGSNEKKGKSRSKQAKSGLMEIEGTRETIVVKKSSIGA